ncbi:putative cytochrome P450 [Hypoxylon sp. FL1284]|nr:putative cytochrome P450 [Hypoxylon sp. FL1284]
MQLVDGFPNYQLAAIALAIALLGYVYRVLHSPLAGVPGPWYTKWTTAVVKYKFLTGGRPRWVHALHEKYGPIVRISPEEVSVADPSATQQMYSVKGEYHKSRFYSDLLPGSETVFSTRDVHSHRRQRRLLASEMSESGLMIYKPVVEYNVRLTIQRMAEEMAERGNTNVYRWCMYMATDIIGELSFGSSFRMLEIKKENQYVKDLMYIGPTGGIRATFPFLMKVNAYIPLPVLSAGMKIRDRLRDYATQSLMRHYQQVAAEGDDAKPSLLSKLYRARENEADTLTFTELRENAMSYIVAGSDTTTNTLTYLLWMVCKRPDIKEKLLAELQTLPEDFEETDLRGLPYLDMIIMETLRMYSAVPTGLPRVVPPGGATLLGHYIPGGYVVSAQAYSMHRNPAVYVDPLRYEPERWAKPTKAMKDSFVAFGGGSRVCLGLHLAKMELRLATALFFSRFPNAKVSQHEGFTDDDMEAEMYFLIAPKDHRCLIELY